ncbi:hypothetical protein RU99_GL000599 [Enterococcus casseliflavus]|nr:hypothetical protein RU99_GL000599 [Enterococcus casseliflavus]
MFVEHIKQTSTIKAFFTCFGFLAIHTEDYLIKSDYFLFGIQK